MWNLKIPKILHLYWGGQRLSYLRYLTVYSFAKLNPDWEIKIHVPTIQSLSLKLSWKTPEHLIPPTHCYFNKLTDIKNVQIVEHLFENDWSDVHRSDWLRWQLLATEGGFWSDFDILYIKSMSNAYFALSKNITDIVCCHEKEGFSGHTIGFLGSAGGSVLAGILHLTLNVKLDDYQSLGSKIINQYLPYELLRNNGSILNIDSDVVYPYNYTNIMDIFKPANYLPDKTIGIHWYAGSPVMSAFTSNFTDPNQYENMLTSLIKQIL